MNALLELAERCEAATGPDRELDEAIWLAENRAGRGTPKGGWRYDVEDAPHYTASLDAAMTLVPEGKSWELKRWGKPYARVGRCSTKAATPALALCAAALRARAAQ